MQNATEKCLHSLLTSNLACNSNYKIEHNVILACLYPELLGLRITQLQQRQSWSKYEATHIMASVRIP